MERLPDEIHLQIIKDLPFVDRKTLRIASRTYNRLIAPLLFSTLKLVGPEQSDNRWRLYANMNSYGVRNYYSQRSVSFEGLPALIPELLPIAPFFKDLLFSPAYFREDFWKHFHQWTVTNNEYIDPDAVGMLTTNDFDPFDSDSEGEYTSKGERIIAEKNKQKLVDLTALMETASPAWIQERAQQDARQESVKKSLASLCEQMSSLQGVCVTPWQVYEFMGLVNDDHHDDAQPGTTSPSWLLVECLAHGMHSAGRRITTLSVNFLCLDHIRPSKDIKHLFSSLTSLRLHFTYSLEVLLDSTPTTESLAGILASCQDRLQVLKLVFGGSRTWLPERGIHHLAKLLMQRGSNDSQTRPLVFRDLSHFELQGIIVLGASLKEFIAAQSQLETAYFSQVFLGDTDLDWHNMAAALPDSLQSWRVDNVGHHPHPIDGLLAYNYVNLWEPMKDRLQPSQWRSKGPKFVHPWGASIHAAQFERV